MAKNPKKQKPPIEVLKELVDLLGSVDSILPSPPSSRSEASESSDKPDLEIREPAKSEKDEDASDEDDLDEESDLGDEDIGEYDESDGLVSITVEELEVAVDDLLSDLNGTLQEFGRREVDSLSHFFGRYYGVKSDITSSALAFEDAINGYVGLVFGDNLEIANSSLRTMIEFVSEEIQK
jgi:hypothetical protein